ncbi:hypothetical protein [Metapseudomonas furukawaii]
MRIALNETAQRRLLAIMAQRGVDSPTHMMNVLLYEAAMEQPIPTTEDVYDRSTTEERPAA